MRNINFHFVKRLYDFALESFKFFLILKYLPYLFSCNLARFALSLQFRVLNLG